MRSPDSLEISENCFWIIRIWEETVSTSYNRMPKLWRYPSHRIGSKGTWVTEEAFSGSGEIREITIDINMMTSPLPLLFSQYITFSLLPVFPQEDLLSVGLTINCRAAYEPKALLSAARPDCLHHRHIMWANELKHINFCLCSSLMWIYSLKNALREGILLALVITSQSFII